MERYFDVVTDRRGNAIKDATVTIKTEAGANATIYSDDGVTTTTNPLTTNVDGEYTFFAANGKYTVQIVADGYGSETKSDQVLYDPSGVSMAIREVTTATYTLTAGDVGQWLDFNTSATATVTMSTASGYATADSTILRQKGAGQVVMAAVGVTLDAAPVAKTRVQKAVIAVTRASDAAGGTAVFSVFGDLAAS